MKPHQLQAFAAVASQLSIRGAARALNVSQPGVTKIVRELEEELGTALVERSTGGVRLTACGTAFAQRARQLLSDMQRTRDEIAQMRDGTHGRVVLAVSTSFALTLLPGIFADFHAAHPGVDVHFKEAVLPDMQRQLREGLIDFAVAHLDPDAIGPEFECTVLYSVQLVVGMRHRHPLRHARTLQQLAAAEWMLPGEIDGAGRVTSTTPGQLRLPAGTRVILGQSVSVALALVGHMDLVGLFVEPLVALTFRHHGLRRIPIDDPLPVMRVCVLHRRNHPLTPAARRLVDAIQAHAGRMDCALSAPPIATPAVPRRGTRR